MSREADAGPNYAILTNRFVSAKQWDRSLAAAMEWLSQQPENLQAHRIAAQSLINLERTDEAVCHIERVLAGNPKDGFAHRLMAIALFKSGKYRLADEFIQKAISLNPTDSFHWHQRALMSQRLGDLVTAKKAIGRARELNPRKAEFLNLAILCEPETAAEEKIALYKEALALSPENANTNNNIGAQYLKLKDFAKAEEFFRRALFSKPTSDIFRRNLFLALKVGDPIYRILCTPKDWLFQTIAYFEGMRKKNLLYYILLVPVWLFCFRFILAGLILWYSLFWPLAKVYEYLTIGDIQTRAGELGARRGGLFGYRRWPVKLRLSLFAIFLISFWGSLVLLCIENEPPVLKEFGRTIFPVLAVAAITAPIVAWVKRNWRKKIQMPI